MNQYVKFGAISAVVLLTILSAIVMTDEVQATDELENQTEVTYYESGNMNDGRISTFNDAHKAIKTSGGKIVLNDNVTINEQYWSSECNLTICLNNYDLNFTGNLNASSEFTLTIEGPGTITVYGLISSSGSGSLYLKNGVEIVSYYSNDIEPYAINVVGTLTIDNATITYHADSFLNLNSNTSKVIINYCDLNLNEERSFKLLYWSWFSNIEIYGGIYPGDVQTYCAEGCTSNPNGSKYVVTKENITISFEYDNTVGTITIGGSRIPEVDWPNPGTIEDNYEWIWKDNNEIIVDNNTVFREDTTLNAEKKIKDPNIELSFSSGDMIFVGDEVTISTDAVSGFTYDIIMKWGDGTNSESASFTVNENKQIQNIFTPSKSGQYTFVVCVTDADKLSSENYIVADVSDVVATIDNDRYSTIGSALDEADDGQTIIIKKDITDAGKMGLFLTGKSVTIDLNGNKVEFTDQRNITIFNASLTLINSDGTSEGIIKSSNANATIVVKGPAGILNVEENVTIEGQNGIMVDSDNGKADGVEIRCTNAKIVSKEFGVYVNGAITDIEGAVPEITISGGTIESDGIGIYAAGYAETTIIDSTIACEEDGGTGIEIRAGNLTISGNTIITGGTGMTEVLPNGSGSTTANVAIAIVQHTTKLPVDVIIRSGTFSATTALLEENVQDNDMEAISKISMAIFDGDFRSKIYSEDLTGYITGGSFILDTNADYIKSGYKLVGGQVQAVDSVATIGDREFATLQEAFEYAQNGDTIELQDHIDQDNGILFDKPDCSITLDLNGKTLNVKVGENVNNRAIKILSGSLTVIDSSSDKTGKIIASGSGTTDENGSGAYGAFRIEADGKLIANHITLENSRPWGLNVKVCGGKAYLTGVTIISSYGGGIEVTEADLGTHSKTGYAELVDCNFVQKGYFDHCSSAVSVSGGSAVTVKGGSYTSEGRAVYVFSSGGYITVEDGYFSGGVEAIRAEIDTSTYPEYVGGVIIEGGEFEGKFSIASPATLAISGGTFDNDPSDYVSNSYHAFESTDGTDTVWTVEKIAATSGDKIYATIQDAINDTGTGTITLADDSAESLTVTGTATISANGYDITGTITVSGTLTLTGTGSVSSVVLSSTSAKLVSGGPTVTSVTDSVSNYHVVSSTIDGVTTYSLARTSSGGGGAVTPPVNPPVTPDEPETDVEEHPDGSTTETTTDTTTNPDGSKTESTTVTEKDPEGNVTGSTVTETTTSEKEEDGVKETVTSTTVTTNDAEGNKTGSTSTSTTTTVTDSTTTVTEKEEVKDADDKVTSSTEKVTETTKIDGGTVTSETTEVKDAAGNVTSSTETVRAESDDGNVRTEAVTESGTTTVNTTVSVSASGQVDDSLIQQAVAQSDAVSEKVSAEAPDRVIQIGTGSDTDITLSPESMSAIADTGAEFRVISETGSMQLDRDVVGTLTEPGEDVTVRMAESDDSDLTEAQQSAKGDRFGVTLTATVGTDRYHLLGGTVTVTIPYTESMGADPASLGVFYIDEDGVRTFMESVYDQTLKSFVFQTDHFSLFVVDDLPASSADDDDTMLYAGMAAVIVVVIVVAAAVILHRKH